MCVCVCDESEKEIFNQMKCAYQYIITMLKIPSFHGN